MRAELVRTWLVATASATQRACILNRKVQGARSLRRGQATPDEIRLQTPVHSMDTPLPLSVPPPRRDAEGGKNVVELQ